MSTLSYPDIIKKTEGLKDIVLSQDELSKTAHKDLFRMGDDAYIIAGNDIVNSIISLSNTDILNIHISAGWENILKTALWKPNNPPKGEIFGLLRMVGMCTEELLPFQKSDINDLFTSLYYGKRLNVLRMVCVSARLRAEDYLKDRNIRVSCHMVYYPHQLSSDKSLRQADMSVQNDTVRIIASSL